MCLAASFCLVVKRVPKVAGMLMRGNHIDSYTTSLKEISRIRNTNLCQEKSFCPLLYCASWFQTQCSKCLTTIFQQTRQLSNIKLSRCSEHGANAEWARKLFVQVKAYRVGRSLRQYCNARPTFQTQFQTRPQQRERTHVKRVCKENSKITLGT